MQDTSTVGIMLAGDVDAQLDKLPLESLSPSEKRGRVHEGLAFRTVQDWHLPFFGLGASGNSVYGSAAAVNDDNRNRPLALITRGDFAETDPRWVSISPIQLTTYVPGVREALGLPDTGEGDGE